jgi:hypothetical protein
MIVRPRGDLRRAKDAALTFRQPLPPHRVRLGAAPTAASTPPRASRRASVPPEPSCLPELIAAPALLPHQLHRSSKKALWNQIDEETL